MKFTEDFHKAAKFLFVILQNIVLTKVTYLSQTHHPTTLQDPEISVVSAATTSQVHDLTILLVLILGNRKIWRCRRNQ